MDSYVGRHATIFTGSDISVEYLNVGSELTLITFEPRSRHLGALVPGKFGPGFGKGRFAPLGFNEVIVKTSRNHWYQTDEMDTAIEIINKVNAGNKVFTYGGSMGGFAAINFAPLLNASAFIALSPLHSVNPRGEAKEVRWAESQLLTFSHDLIASGRCRTAKGYAFFDRHNDDERHAALISRDTEGGLFPLEFGSHPCSFYLNEAYGLKRLVKEIATGEFSRENFYRDLDQGTLSTYYPYARRGRELTRSGQSSEAIAELKKAISFKPTVPGLHSIIGDLYLSAGDLDLAEHHFKYSIGLAKQSRPFVRLSYVHAKRGNFADAVAAMNEAILLSPNRPEYFVRLGEWLIRAGDLEAAAKAMQKAIEIKPNAVVAPKRLADIRAVMARKRV